MSITIYFFNFLNLLAKLWEEGKLDLDAAIQTYVTSFPTKTFKGSTATLTTRHLLSHLGGIRHYDKTQCNKENKTNTDNKVCFLGRKGHIVIIIIVVPKMLIILSFTKQCHISQKYNAHYTTIWVIICYIMIK